MDDVRKSTFRIKSSICRYSVEAFVLFLSMLIRIRMSFIVQIQVRPSTIKISMLTKP